MKNKLNWRLGKLPTSEEVRELVKDKLITHEEAREILFNHETEEDRDKKSLESEIKFLRDLVEKLSDNKMSRIIEVVKQYQPIYIKDPWYQPYYTWCNVAGQTYLTSTTSSAGNIPLTVNSLNTSNNLASYGMSVNAGLQASSASTPSFSSIKTF